jgi:hypothetical protein
MPNDSPKELTIKDVKPPKPVKIDNKSIVILRKQGMSMDGQIESLEEKYAVKFGCKVIVLESGLEYVEQIDG